MSFLVITSVSWNNIGASSVGCLVTTQQAHNLVATSFAGYILTSELGQWEVVFAKPMTLVLNVVTTLKSDVVAASCSGCTWRQNWVSGKLYLQNPWHQISTLSQHWSMTLFFNFITTFIKWSFCFYPFLCTPKKRPLQCMTPFSFQLDGALDT